MQRKALTLTELAVILVIVSFLGFILLPPNAFTGGARHNARRSSCQSNLKQIALALRQYAGDYNQTAPPISSGNKGWRELLSDYAKVEVFQCPSADSADSARTDYFSNGLLSQKKSAAVFQSSQVVTFGDGPDSAPNNFHLSEFPLVQKDEEGFWSRHLGGANYAFADGHVKWLRPENARRQFHFKVEKQRIKAR